MKLQSTTLVIARVLLALIFVAAGVNKAMHYADTAAYMASMGVPAVLLPLVIALEFGGGIAVLIGYRIQLSACLLAAFTLAAGAIFHHGFGDPVQLIMFMKNLAIAGGLIALAAAGPGNFSMDARARVGSLRGKGT